MQSDSSFGRGSVHWLDGQIKVLLPTAARLPWMAILYRMWLLDCFGQQHSHKAAGTIRNY